MTYDENSKTKIKIIDRTLQIICLNFTSKLSEIKEQHNFCYVCNSDNIKYPKNYPKAVLTSSEVLPYYFTAEGMIQWTAKCNNCGNDMPICISYEFDKDKGFKIISHDFF